MRLGLRLLVAATIASATIACGSSKQESDAANEPGCSTAPQCGSCQACYDTCVCKGKSTDACIAECQSGLGGASSGGTGGATAGTGGAATGGTAGTYPDVVTIKTTKRVVPAYDEAFFCQNFANPFGRDVDVIQSESFMTPGSHHLFVFYEPGATDGPVEDCSGLEFQKAVHGAQVPQLKIDYPPGVGRHFGTDSGIRVLAHYLNTTDKDIDAEITVVFNVVPAGTIQYEAASVFFNNLDLYVPKLSSGQATKTCTLPYDIKLLSSISHMHQYGTSFVAKTGDGTVLYQGTDWSEPITKNYEPPLDLKMNTQITWTCSYDNTANSSPLTFGESAKTNEMCIFAGTYYPAPGGESIVCM
jgi:hypothetical protein